jgi:hypothetical protein
MLFIKEEILTLAETYINLGNVMLSEMRKTEKEKALHDFIYLWNLKEKLETEDRKVVTKVVGVGKIRRY